MFLTFRKLVTIQSQCLIRGLHILTGSMAYKAGVQPNDLLMSINSQNVSFLNADMVAKIIRLLQ